MNTTTLHVTATKNRRGWTLVGVEHGAVSQVARLDQAAAEMREPLAYLSGLPEDGFEIEVTPEIPEAFGAEQAEARRLRAEADHSRAAAAEHSRRAARVLADAGLSVRDIGHVMGVSHQRAHQLVKA
ncbi:MAG: hypothetical protein LBL01_07445 [Bifidobacteriaceae bacterium]|jgi:hypothetical protein|nr:hypothetical protein [Bifidobacteriaceae bacterium]